MSSRLETAATLLDFSIKDEISRDGNPFFELFS